MGVEVAQVIIASVVAIWGIYQIVAARKLTKLTSDLNQNVHLLNTNLDQSIQRLHRARDLVNKIHAAEIYLGYGSAKEETSEGYLAKLAEWSVYEAELRGLAIAINDQEFLEIVNELRIGASNLTFLEKEAVIRNKSQRLYTRIYQLLETSTLSKSKIS